MGKKIDLTAVITAHDEGLVAHKTMLSVFGGISKAEEAGYTCEILIHIDNGDKITKEYFERYRTNPKIRIFENKFGDLGPSRNFAVGQALGEHVSFLDADDLMSDNWFVRALDTLKNSNGEAVVYPEAVLTFSVDKTPNVLTIQKTSVSLDEDIMILIGENRWGSVVMAKKDTFLKYPYFKKTAGYNYEDYVFNIETVYAGVEHKVAEGTVLFYRRSNHSMLSKGNQSHATIPYMEAFDFDKIKDNKTEIFKPNFVREHLKERGYRAYKKVRNNRFLNTMITPVAKATLKVLDNAEKHNVPDFVIEEWKEINKVDSQLYPHQWLIDKVQFYAAEKQIEVGNIYRKLARDVTSVPDYVFIVPWVVRGGADKVLFNYIKALHEINAKWHFAVITTLPADNTWAKDFPGYVDCLDFGNLAEGLAPVLAETLFTRLIVQLKCKNIHIINSEYGYEWAMNHADLLKAHFKLNVSLFAEEYIPGSEMRAIFSYDNPYLLELINVVNKVFTDNKTVINNTILRNGFDRNKFVVHYQPIDEMQISIKKEKRADGRMHILWAGRLVNIKMPQVVAEIARGLDHEKYVIDVYGEFSDEVSRGVFDGLDNVNYHGAYDGFKELPIVQFDVFLYTSLTDGVPNTILEAAAAGIPIIASNDGGVHEVIRDHETGILIDNLLSPDEYINAIKWARKNSAKMQEYAEAAKKMVKKQHSWQGFVETVEKDLF